MSKVASVASFISEIQSSLSDEAFQTFKKALGVYKDVSCPYHCSCDHLWLLAEHVRSSLEHKLSVQRLYQVSAILSFGCRVMTFIHSLKN